MQDKNDRLAKENNNLKSIITQRMKVQEEALKKSIKAEYNQILTYRQMLEVVEESILSLEGALEQCKAVQSTILKNRTLLGDKTNFQSKSLNIKNRVEECKYQTEAVVEDIKQKQSNITEKDIDVMNSVNKRKKICKRKNSVKTDLFDSWERNEI